MKIQLNKTKIKIVIKILLNVYLFVINIKIHNIIITKKLIYNLIKNCEFLICKLFVFKSCENTGKIKLDK